MWTIIKGRSLPENLLGLSRKKSDSKGQHLLDMSSGWTYAEWQKNIKGNEEYEKSTGNNWAVELSNGDQGGRKGELRKYVYMNNMTELILERMVQKQDGYKLVRETREGDTEKLQEKQKRKREKMKRFREDERKKARLSYSNHDKLGQNKILGQSLTELQVLHRKWYQIMEWL